MGESNAAGKSAQEGRTLRFGITTKDAKKIWYFGTTRSFRYQLNVQHMPTCIQIQCSRWRSPLLLRQADWQSVGERGIFGKVDGFESESSGNLTQVSRILGFSRTMNATRLVNCRPRRETLLFRSCRRMVLDDMSAERH
ncbi:hypothetical protein BN2476_300067 [Paraburkholderia piptadeniae]|uniref:Uncharacterized protein n=1 Tax=Paraburkholderia piptadeniae TaxID=1701573 RepID=A0A1N7S2D0_9BURK|nr:hypothetical protein BN2476_300067 [Paraburkholderia piptadeniae]